MLLRPAAGGLGATGPDPGGTDAAAYKGLGDVDVGAVVVEAAAEAGRFLLRRVLAPGALGDPDFDVPDANDQAAVDAGGRLGGSAAASTTTPAMSPQMQQIINWYSIGSDILCLLSLFAGLAVIYKLAKRPRGLMRGNSATNGPHSMKRFMDQVVLVMSCIDVVFAAVLIVTLTWTWKKYTFQGDTNHWIWWAFAQFCWLPQFYHCYIASVCFNWVVRRHSVARLQRTFPRAVAIILATVALQSTVALCLNYLDVHSSSHDSSAKTLAYAEYLVVHIATQLCILWFYIATCFSLVGHLRGGQKVNRSYRKIVWRFIKMCAMSLVVWNFWTAVMVMWYRVFATQLAIIMFLTIPTFSYPFLDAVLMGNVFELYKRGPTSEEARRQQQGGPVTIASTSVKCLESRTGAYHRQSGRSSTNLLGHPRYAGAQRGARAGGAGEGGASVFTTTLNLGGVKDIRKLGGSLDEWIPPDYDVYCVGVQECAILEDLRAALHAHLGGPEHYTMFTAEIGAATVLYGTIALTAFARTREVESGAFSRIDALAGRLRNGVNLVVTKTANKGMVGMAFRYHDATLGFVTAHFASDSNGKKRLRKRNEDAYQMLRSLCLTDTEEGFDFHLELHHTFVMGDLNYRIAKLDAQGMVERTAQAARQAMRILHHQAALAPEEPSQQWAGTALGLPLPLGLAMEQAAHTQREDSDRNVRFGLPESEEEPARIGRGVSFQEPAPTSPVAVGSGGRVSWVRERYLRLFPHVPAQPSLLYHLGRSESSTRSALAGSVAVEVAVEVAEEETKAAGAEDHRQPAPAMGTGAGKGEDGEEGEDMEMEIGPVGLALHRRWSGLTTEQEQRQRRRLHPHPLALGESSSSFLSSVGDGGLDTPPLSPPKGVRKAEPAEEPAEEEDEEEMEPDSDEEEYGDEDDEGEDDDSDEGGEDGGEGEEAQAGAGLDSSSSPLVVVPVVDEEDAAVAGSASETDDGGAGGTKARQWFRQSLRGMQNWLSTTALAPGGSGAGQRAGSSSRAPRGKKKRRKGSRRQGQGQQPQVAGAGGPARRVGHVPGLSDITEASAEEADGPSSATSTGSGNSVYVPKRGGSGKKRPHSTSSSGSSSSANDVFVSGSSSTSAPAPGSNRSLETIVAAVPPTITTALSSSPDKDEDGAGAGVDGARMERARARRRSTRRLPSDRRLVPILAPGERPRVAHAWQWVNEVDELQGEMRAGRVFHGFSEGEIQWPSSFRWRRGAVAGDFTDPQRLAASYVLRKKGDGERVPSYTDRILFHSLADVRGNLTLVAYELCDTITGSDHRPVSAGFELRLNKKVIGFRTLRDDPQQPPHSQSSPPLSPRTPSSPPAALRQLTPAVDYPTASVWSVTLSQVAYAGQDAAPGASTSSSPASSSATMTSSSSSGRGEHSSSSGGGGGAGAASSGNGSGSGCAGQSKPAPTPNGEWTLTVHFPSLLEDPFAHDRQMRLLEEAIEGGSSSAAAAARQAALAAQQQQQQQALTPKSAPVTVQHRNGVSSLGRSFSVALPLPHWGSQTRISDLPPAPMPAGVQPSALGAAFGQAAALTTRAHQATWAQASGAQGTSFKVLVLPEVSRHALVKVTDSKGVEVGQGVICLRHAFPTASRSSRTGAVQIIRRLVRGHAADDRRLEIPLSLGGRAAGTLSLRIGIHKREYAYELVRPQIAMRAPAPQHASLMSLSPKPAVAFEGGDEGKQEGLEGDAGGGSGRRVAFDVGGASND